MQKIYWDLLKKNHEESKKRRIESLFESDENRFRKFSLKIEDLYFDYSKTNIDPLTLSNLIKFAENSEIMKNVDAMFNGDKINVTENRSVLHTALRNFQTRKFNNLDSINKKEVELEALKVASSMLGSSEDKRASKLKINALIRDINDCIASLSD